MPSWRQLGLSPSPSSSTPTVDAHEFGALNTLGLCTVLGLCVFAGYWLKQRKFYYLPESAAIMLIGALTGGLVEWLWPTGDELSFLKFNPQMFFFVLLPPIIFEAGYKLNKKGFFSNFTTIILYAVFGTLVSTFVIGGLLYGFAELNAVPLENHTPIEALLFGALISAVDPVATLAIMGAKEVNCDPMLYSLIFGESVLNDAVAIVLFHTLQGFDTQDRPFNIGTVFSVLGQFLGVSLGSILIGVVCGLICCGLMKYSSLYKYPKYEITVLFLTAFGSFSLGEAIEWEGGGLSGIMSLFFCGITLSHYNYYNLSEASQVSSSFVFETMASISETIVFAYIGTSVFSSEHRWSFSLIILSILFCAGARALNTFPFSACANIKRKKKIPMKMQVVIWFAGLRGAIAFALAMTLTTPNKGYIVTTTLCIVIFTTIVCGGSTEPLLRKMGMQRKKSRARVGTGPDSLAQNMLNPYLVGSSNGVAVRKKSGGVHGWWKGFDSKFMKPLFGGTDPSLRRDRDRDEAGNNSGNNNTNKNASMEHLRSGADINIGSSGDFEKHSTSNADGQGEAGEVDEATMGLVNRDAEQYSPPRKDKSEELSKVEHPEDIF